MKNILSFLSGMLLTLHSFGQAAADIPRIMSAQQNLHTYYAKMERQDTLVSGQTRHMTGTIRITMVQGDSLFGFKFQARRDDINSESIYDGHSGCYIDHEKKSYEIKNSEVGIGSLLGYPGGQLICTDFFRLDTANATGFKSWDDDQYHYLQIFLSDIDKYDVRLRSKTLTIDRNTYLPVAVRLHQVTLDKVQDLYYHALLVKINDESLAYDFSKERFPSDYGREAETDYSKLFALKGKPHPAFDFISIDNKPVQLEGKVVLLDFWEVWCTPCVASMSKVQALYEKYKDKGFVAYGVLHEKEYIETAKQLIRKQRVTFPIGIGTATSKKNYCINGVPQYVLIGRDGIISFISIGYSDQLEELIREKL